MHLPVVANGHLAIRAKDAVRGRPLLGARATSGCGCGEHLGNNSLEPLEGATALHARPSAGFGRLVGAEGTVSGRLSSTQDVLRWKTPWTWNSGY